jgi:hypothetical protein
MSIGFSAASAHGKLDQPVEIRADHRVLAGALGHALETLQLLARLLLDSSGIFASVDGLVELRDFGGALVALAQLLLDRAHLLAQQVLALQVVERTARAFRDVARDLEHFDPVREQLEQRVHARL